jgi:four helix bundle protein
MPDSPIFVKVYDLIVWLLPQTLKFTREYRFTFASRLQTCALDLQRALVQANKASTTADIAAALRQADVELTELRLDLRLSNDLNMMQPNSYAHAARLVDEVGRLLGGWQKKNAQHI